MPDSMYDTLKFLFKMFLFPFYRTTTRLTSDNTASFLQISRLQYQMGELEDALR